MNVLQLLESANEAAEGYKSIYVKKHLELDYDVGRLMAADPNDLDYTLLRRGKEDFLRDLTRDNTQLLINKIWELPTERVDEAIIAKLPLSNYALPRAKPVPTPKPLTKWQQFALDKGIKKTKQSKLSWDEQLQKWIPKYGYKRAAAEKDKDWVLEVPQNADPYEDQFAKKAMAKSEKVAKNELQRLRNIAKAKNIKVPKTGLLNPDVSSAKELQTAVTVAKSSTASVGKFQNKLPKEKEATNVHTLVPGGSRKRKLPPISGDAEKQESLNLIDSVLNKKPKIHIEKAVAIQLNKEQIDRSEENHSGRPKAGRSGKVKGNAKNAKKPKGRKGLHKGPGNKGRKRR